MSQAQHDEVVPSDPDADMLRLLGKKQVLKRRFGLWSLFAFATCELITWETVLVLVSQGLSNGGPAGLVYGFIIAWLSTLYVLLATESYSVPIRLPFLALTGLSFPVSQ
jgi:hypothetical protein